MQLHHIAYVTKNIEKKAREMCELLGLEQLTQPVIDEERGVRILFLDLGNDVQLELLEPYGENSPVESHLKQGGGLYHLCFEVDDLAEQLADTTGRGKALLIKDPSPAPAIDGRRVAFVVSPGRDVFEFVEPPKK